MQYHFLSRADFERLRDQGKDSGEKGAFFVETAEFGGNLYGTSVGAVEEVSRGKGRGVEKEGGKGTEEGNDDGVGRCCVLDIEMEVR